jgi:hypothetical protein
MNDMNERRRHPIWLCFLVITTTALSAYLFGVMHKLVVVMVSGQ